MRNYYEELKINSTDSVEAINKQLAQLESTWKRREITNPDKATIMLALIIEARKVFINETTREDYDYKLKESIKGHSQNNYSQNEKVQKWKNEAKEYFELEQYDIAKGAIDKALSYLSEDDEESELFALAAEIYKENNIISTAIDYINKAILLCPDKSEYYMTKGFIYEKSANIASKNENHAFAQEYYSKACKQFRMVAEKTQNNYDNDSYVNALGEISYILYFYLSSPEEAEQLALQVKELGGDNNGNAVKVLKKIQAKRNKEEIQNIKSEEKKKHNRAISLQIKELNKDINETTIDDLKKEINNHLSWLDEHKALFVLLGFVVSMLLMFLVIFVLFLINEEQLSPIALLVVMLSWLFTWLFLKLYHQKKANDLNKKVLEIEEKKKKIFELNKQYKK